ncbi:MAG: hypothetical protein VX032_12780 [SAR324 cluster bacterium]|nr:hypothetical protein [SAR324 cluster bacterium]
MKTRWITECIARGWCELPESLSSVRAGCAREYRHDNGNASTKRRLSLVVNSTVPTLLGSKHSIRRH